jgi:hypothetical protein
MAIKLKDAWRISSFLVDVFRSWRKIDVKNPITPKRITDTLRRIWEFLTIAVILVMLTGCQTKVSVKVYKHVPEPTQVLPTPDPPQVFDVPERSVLVTQAGVILRCADGSRGSGTLYRPDAIVTCYHTFRDSQAGITATFRDGVQVAGTLVYFDATYDVAVIQIAPVSYTPAKISTSKNLDGAFEAHGFGAPGESFQAARGRFVRWVKPTRSGSVASTLVLNVPVRPGDSGGGIFNDGGLYGVIWGSADGETYGTSGAGFREIVERANAKLDRAAMRADRLVVYTDPPNCAPCTRLLPVLAQLRREGYNVVETEPTATITRIPTLVFYKGDVVIEQLIGYYSVDDLRAKFTK